MPAARHPLRRAGRGLAALVAAVLLLIALTLLVYRARVLPQIRGSVELAGPRAPITIERDADGIPTIKAASAEDAWFGLGFVHAQDRLWQLETHKRIAAGRLSEAFGAPSLDTDRFLRALGVRRAAARQWARADAATRTAFDAYAAGINAFLHTELRARPPEFVLLGLQPGDWDPVDSVGWAVMMAWDLGGNWSNELLRMRLAQRLPTARLNELLPPYPGEPPLFTVDYAARLRAWQVAPALGRTAARAAPESGVEGVGSNNWVVDARHSATGAPLLANDPHLKLTAPALWYLARLEAPGLVVAGATMPGLPFVVLGQNRQIAWGFTNTAPDVQDLYLERLKPDDASQYQTPTGWAPFERFDEVIKVKGQPDVRLVTRATRHGPVISDAGGNAAELAGAGHVLALRWTALDDDPGTLATGLAFNTAHSVAGFIAAAQGHVAPMQNMVVAERGPGPDGAGGHIAEISAGRVPLRRADNDLHGLAPAPGWDARYDWVGFVPADATPRELDPPRGWIATANQRIHAPDYPHFLTSEWTWPYRQQRIESLLAARPVHDLASLRAIQADQLSLGALRLLPTLRRTHSDHPLAARAEAAIAAFDGRMAADQAAPAIYQVWARHLTELVLADELGPDWAREFGNHRSFRDGLEAIVERDDAWWCDDKTTPAVETCIDRSRAALDRTLDELGARLGPDPAAWRWGDLHIARSEHRPFSRVRPLARWFELRTPVGGDGSTVNVARVNLRPDATSGERYLSEHGPSLRALYDLADARRSRVMHSSGQSGIVLSPHYRDFVERWRAVQDLPLWPATPPDATLTLRPRAAP